ncbi:MAG TPA: hypothetical protein VN578_06860, partial [Candidatus Binatia bacterium]|nr:hypothetical protein [Candidatus Binatia bacterium]
MYPIYSLTKWSSLVALWTLLAQCSSLAQGTAFTYQGRLTDNGSPANGNYDLRFTLYDAASGGAVLGGPVTNTFIGVSNGFFTVVLDFGASPFDGGARWVDIGARSNGVATIFTTLSPRQELTATPYAIRAANFSGPVADTQLSTNIARLNGTFALGPTNDNNAVDLNRMVGVLADGLHVGRFLWTNALTKIGTRQPLRLMFYGNGWVLDSTLVGVFYNLTNYLPVAGAYNVGIANNFSWPGYHYVNPVKCQIGSDNTQSIGNGGDPDTNWLQQYLILTNSSSSIELQANGDGFPATFFQLDYIAASDGGSFKIQTNINGGAYADLAGYTSVSSFNADSATGKTISWAAANPVVVNARILATTPGTNRIVSFDAYDATKTNGVILQVYAHQGVSWSQVNQVSTNTQQPIITSWHPDLVLVPGSDGDASTQLDTLNEHLLSWSPDADVVFCEFWQTDPASDASATAGRAYTRSACVRLDRSCFDPYQVFPSYSESVARGYIGYGGHLSPLGYTYYWQLLWDWLGLVEYMRPNFAFNNPNVSVGMLTTSSGLYSFPHTVTNSTDSTLGFGAGLLRW